MTMSSARPPAQDPLHARSANAAIVAWQEARSDAGARAASLGRLKRLAGVVVGADALTIFVLSVLAAALRHGITDIPSDVFAIAGLASLITINFIALSSGYGDRLRERFPAQITRCTQAWSIAFGLLLVMAYLTKTLEHFSRIWAVLWYASVLLALAVIRLVAAGVLDRWKRSGRLVQTVAIVDIDGQADEFVQRLTRRMPGEIQVLGIFGPDGHARPRCGIDDLVALARLFRIDEVFVLLPARHEALTAQDYANMLRRLGTIPTNVRLCPWIPELGELPIREAGLAQDMLTLTVHRRPLGGWDSVAKRAEDIVIGSIVLLMIAPVLLVVAIAVKLDSPGPIIFKQRRQGFNGNVFMVWKFRSMTHRPVDDGSVVQATREDQRVTRVGRFIRKTSLDELPQFFNVLRGDMSLVGPRPHAIVHNIQYGALIDVYLGRHRVQPGITGWAQVNGLRGETDTLEKMRRRVDFDLDYINNWSVGLDLKIILKTIIAIPFDRQAY